MVKGSPLVLVVDDEPQMCNILQRILKENGYQVVTAPDGETALQLVREKKPDVILLDLMMPGIDGREVCRRVRQLATASRIIYLTAKMGPIKPSESRELHREADGFIGKPATSKQILSTLRSVLQSARQ